MSVARYSGTYWDVAWWIMIGALAAWLTLQLMSTPVYGVSPENAATQPEQLRSTSRIFPQLAETWAIVTAGRLDMGTALNPLEWTAEPSRRPLVRDLPYRLGAERFEGAAHHMLGHLMLERGNSDLAEEHFDAAVDLGVKILFSYGELTDCYEEQGRHLNTARTHVKERRNRLGKGSASVKLLDNLTRAMLDVAPY